MKKAIFVAGSAIVLLTGMVAWLQAAPSIGAAAANPAYVVINTPTTVTITIPITDASLLPGGVNLLRTDAAGKTISTLGVMHDDGLNGDVKAGDKIFSYQVPVNQPTIGQVYYRASAAFKGVLQRVLSNLVVVTVDPFKLPPDPGESGKQTIEGIDSDHDGVRDDLQRYISINYAGQDAVRRAVSQYTQAAVSGVLSPQNVPAAMVSAEQTHRSLDCLYALGGYALQKTVSVELLQKILNTPERKARYTATNNLLGGQVFELTPREQRSAQCH